MRIRDLIAFDTVNSAPDLKEMATRSRLHPCFGTACSAPLFPLGPVATQTVQLEPVASWTRRLVR